MLCYSLIFGVKKSRAYLMESIASLLVGRLNSNLFHFSSTTESAFLIWKDKLKIIKKKKTFGKVGLRGQVDKQ